MAGSGSPLWRLWCVQLLTCCADKTLRLWEVLTLRETRIFMVGPQQPLLVCTHQCLSLVRAV